MRSSKPDTLAQLLLDVTPAIILLLSPEGRIEHVNPAFERLTGWSLADLCGREWFCLLPERDRDRIRRLFATAVTGTATRGHVNPILTRAGDEHEIEWHDQVLRDETGAATGLVAVGIDVTERKRAEDVARRSTHLLRTVMTGAPVVIFGLDRESRFTLSEGQALKLLGLSPGQMVGVSALEVYRDVTGFEAAFRRALNGETVVLDSQVGEIQFEAVYAPSMDAHGAIDGVIGVAFDVSDRRRAERALRESETRLRRAQAIAMIGNWELDVRTGRLWWSDEIYHIFERDPASFTASYQAFLAAIHPDDRERVNAAYTSSLTTREPYHITHRLLAPDGRVKWVEERCETAFADDGSPLRSRGTVQDVTERVQGEEALRSSLREKEILLREVHHRVKNNLQIISSLLHFQAKRVKHADDLAAFEDARQRLHSMGLVHERLYRTSDLSAVGMPGYLAALAVAVQQSQAGRGHVTVSVTCDPLRLPVDVAMPLGLLASELLTNVLKHAFRDERTGQAELRLVDEGARLTMTVCDNGCGLPTPALPDGAGSFGWQLVRALTEQLGGEVSVTVDQGTQVSIRVPWQEAP